MALNYCSWSDQRIYVHLKQTLADIVGIDDYNTIYASHNLSNAPFGFDNRGKRALANRLNKAFADEPELTRDETGGATTVKDLYSLLRKRCN